MTSSQTTLRILAVLVLAIALAGCNERRDTGFQGWVEADMIFVSPDESGRVTKLNVREGEEVKPGMQIYSVDDDLQQADLNQNNATLGNAAGQIHRNDRNDQQQSEGHIHDASSDAATRQA